MPDLYDLYGLYDLYDVYDLYDLHDLYIARVSLVGSVLCRYLHNLSAEELDDVDHHLSRGCEKDVSEVSCD